MVPEKAAAPVPGPAADRLSRQSLEQFIGLLRQTPSLLKDQSLFDLAGRLAPRPSLADIFDDQPVQNTLKSRLATRMLAGIGDEASRSCIRRWLVDNPNLHSGVIKLLSSLEIQVLENLGGKGPSIVALRPDDCSIAVRRQALEAYQALSGARPELGQRIERAFLTEIGRALDASLRQVPRLEAEWSRFEQEIRAHGPGGSPLASLGGRDRMAEVVGVYLADGLRGTSSLQELAGEAVVKALHVLIADGLLAEIAAEPQLLADLDHSTAPAVRPDKLAPESPAPMEQAAAPSAEVSRWLRSPDAPPIREGAAPVSFKPLEIKPLEIKPLEIKPLESARAPERAPADQGPKAAQPAAAPPAPRSAPPAEEPVKPVILRDRTSRNAPPPESVWRLPLEEAAVVEEPLVPVEGTEGASMGLSESPLSESRFGLPNARVPDEGIDFEELHYYQTAEWLEGTSSTLGEEASRHAASAIESILRKEEQSISGLVQAEAVQHGHPEVTFRRDSRARQDGQPDEQVVLNKLLALLAMGGEFTHQHSVRVNDLALGLCDELGIHGKTREQIKYGSLLKDIGEADFLLARSGPEMLRKRGSYLDSQDMWKAGVLHDLGKLRIPEEILYKPGKLTQEEFEIIKMHPIYGERILWRFPELRHLCPAVRAHHERWDGKGYPDKLKGQEIPFSGRVIALADVFDALYADRPYRAGMPFEKVCRIMEEGAGTHFDPQLVEPFLRVVRKLHRQGKLKRSSSAPGKTPRSS